ncbi:MAG: hypothetical protein H6589_00010 [Flavobacteriales bacterium]|nr:hypothetical protein [Flavobacteriales bacterium]
MKKNKTYVLFISMFATFVLANTPSFAQKPIDTTTIITVKPYDPVLSDAFKIKEHPTIQDTDKVIPKLSYTFINKQVPVDFQVENILPAKIKGEPLVKLYRGYAKAGFGSQTTPLAELYFNSQRSKEFSYGFFGKHQSSSGISNIDYSEYSDNHLSLFGKRFLKEFTLYSKLNFDRNMVHYYGFPEKIKPEITNGKELRQRLTKLSANAGLTRNFTDSSQFDYNFDINYHHIFDIHNTEENNLRLDGSLSKYHKRELYAIDAEVNYNNLNNVLDLGNTLMVGLRPYIKTSAKSWQFKVGLGLYVNQADSVSKFHFYPEAEFKYNVVENIIIPYVGIKGGILANNLNSYFNENPFINTKTLAAANTNQKYNIYIGIRGSLSKHVTFNTSFSKQQLETMPLFVKDFSNVLENQFTVLYDTVGLNQISGELAYQKLEKLKIIVRGDYFDYSPANELKAWHKPDMKISLSGIYDLSDKIIVRTDLFFINKQYAKAFNSVTDASGVIIITKEAKELKGVFDANLGLEYRYTKKLSAFINFNNIGAVHYQKFEDYPTQRFNVMGGLTYSF